MRTRRKSFRRGEALIVVACWVATAAGCAHPDEPPCFPVRGQVIRDAKPLHEAMIVFHPLFEPPHSFPKPVAYTDERGQFELQTFRYGDGAPAGQYAITIELRQPRAVGEEVIRDGRNLLPARFSRPETSDLRYTVVDGSNEVPPLVIPAR